MKAFKMVKFLLYRPIALTMTYIAILILGAVAVLQLPVSLMPDIDIPEITVQVSSKNLSARELESTVIKPLRQSLLQVEHLDDIKSETRDGHSFIHLKFDYGTDIDFTFIEVNDKIDRAMNSLPRDIDRPRVVKASATDIPIFYLNVTLKNDADSLTASNELFPVSQKFVELSNFTTQVIRKRIEQLDEVAMVDMSGMVYPELLIIPDMEKLEALGISLTQLEESIVNMNLALDNLLIRDGQYLYNIRFATSLQNKRDIEEIYLKIEDRLLQLKNLAQVIEHPQKRQGMVTFQGKNTLTLAIIKQSDAQLKSLKDKLYSLVDLFRNDYPHIEFTITRDQTALLDYSIDNLLQSLTWGAFFAFILMFFFLKDIKSPVLICISVPTSLVISLLFFHLVGLSINIISLSGLVLGVGMMIDNSIIVIDNISQYYARSGNLIQACIQGTNEVIRPLLSSVLTTCAVFIPLIFISGIAGAIFYDQAISVTIGLFVSLVVSITLLPVYFKLLYQKRITTQPRSWLNLLTSINYEALYEKGFRFTMRHQAALWVIIVLMLAGATILYVYLDKERLPPFTKDEIIVEIDWNEPIHVDENNRRSRLLIHNIQGLLEQNTCMVGQQQFLLDRNEELSTSEVLIYLKATSPENLQTITKKVSEYMGYHFPGANFTFEEAGNIFNLIFSDEESPLQARLRPLEINPQTNFHLQHIIDDLSSRLGEYTIQPIAWQEHMLIKTDPVKLLTYDISFDDLFKKLKSAFRENEIMVITESQSFTPVILGGESQQIREILTHAQVENKEGKLIPVRNLIKENTGFDLKTIQAGQEGEFFPLNLDVSQQESKEVMNQVRQVIANNKHFEVSFTGSIFFNQELVKKLTIILSISLLLLYFILASQFESLILPFIVLLEVPIDIFGAFFMLYLFDVSINLMSMIGIIVMSGIIVNDSILKIDTINQLRNEGYSVMRALALAGQRRLKPILMTSLTTILALLPLLFTSGLGADLQKPLALAVIGGMSIGTLVSLYFIPLCYHYLNGMSKKQAL